MKHLVKDQSRLIEWYRTNKRTLPWRKNHDPYRIWISEVMLQQTTVTAVIPFYEKFMSKFPNLKSLAQASEADVFESWAGLGYYSRARNLHKAAKILAEVGFAKTYSELIQHPGFGPYTSRAVSSIAFDDPVGVLDGNVIRILSRRFNLATEWWKPQAREELQRLSDQFVQGYPSSEMNQAMMELGATICTPQNPVCLLCPIKENCQARLADTIESRPLKKPKKEFEVWVWEPHVISHKSKIALIQNDYAPFLKKQWMFPGQAKKIGKKPNQYDFKHGITHHEIFVRIKHSRLSRIDSSHKKEFNWIESKDLAKINPASLLRKTLDHLRD